MIAQTSLEAYWSIPKETISKRQKQVLDTLYEIYPACNREIAEKSGIPINVVTPRMGELRKKRLVVEAYVNIDITGKRVMFWKPKDVEKEEGDVA